MNVSTLSILSEACNNILFHKKEVKEEKKTHTQKTHVIVKTIRNTWDHRGRGFTTSYAISVYHH